MNCTITALYEKACFFHNFKISLARYRFIILNLLLLLQFKPCSAQAVRENGKWGYRLREKLVVPAAYDTVFGFDTTGKVCLACIRSKSSNNSKFIKVTSTSYACHYYDGAGKKLVVRNQLNDTFSVFSYNKSTLKNYQGPSRYFTVAVKNKKYLLLKDGRQLTFNDYHDVRPTSSSEFYVAQVVNDMDVVVTGLVNHLEQTVIPFQYSDIVVNMRDSLIICCSAGINANAGDDVYNFEGKKFQNSQKHIDLATKNFLVHKIFEPKEHFLIYNISKKQETPLQADEVAYLSTDELLIKIKNDWFVYDMQTNLKKPKSKS